MEDYKKASKLKLLIFDAYGTLISTGTGSLEATKAILKLRDKDISPDVFYADWKKCHRKNLDIANNNQFVDEATIFQQDLTELYEKYHIDGNAKQDVQIMLETLETRSCYNETLSVIESLRKDYRVVIGSTTDTQPLLHNMENNRLVVDAVYTSEMIQKYKPAEDFYLYILEQEKCRAEEAVFIGDSYLDDVYGPTQVGMKAILLKRKQYFYCEENEIKPYKVIKSLEQVRNIVDNA